ncbi:MAG: MBL fold metallo-hydrolase, partial [Coxiellaceae bacterium]|nr:MBL fold metallo-hydrolase [Coxiellaceae bacterium]
MKRFALFLLMISLSFPALSAEFTLHPSQAKLLQSKNLRIILCGTGDPEPKMQMLRHPGCLAVIGDKQFFLIDAGEGAIQTLGGMGLPIANLNPIFMTHWHSDHFGGLGQVINETWIAGRKKPLLIYGPTGVNAIVNALMQAYRLDARFRIAHRKGLLKASLAFGVPKKIVTTKQGKQVYKQNNLAVSAFLVNHNPVVPAFGYRIQYQDCKIVVSGDTKVVQSLGENAKNADLLINEAYSHYYYQKNKQRADNSKNPKMSLAYLEATHSYHSDTIALAKMAQKYHVKHLVITHLVPAVGTSWFAKRKFIKGMSAYYKGP